MPFIGGGGGAVGLPDEVLPTYLAGQVPEGAVAPFLVVDLTDPTKPILAFEDGT